MARTQVQLPADGVGKSLLAFDLTEPGAPAPNNGVRHVQGLVICDTSGNPIDTLASTPAGTERALVVRSVGASQDLRYTGGKIPVSGVVSTAGDNVIATPAAGKRIRLVWISFIPNSDNTAANLVKVKLSALQPYTNYAMSHWEVFTGEADAPLILNLANTQPVAYTAHYQEVAAAAPAPAAVYPSDTLYPSNTLYPS